MPPDTLALIIENFLMNHEGWEPQDTVDVARDAAHFYTQAKFSPFWIIVQHPRTRGVFTLKLAGFLY